MLGVKRTVKYRGDSTGHAWPCAGNTGTIQDAYGPRLYSAHVATIGYDYDLHPGIDVASSAADPVYSTIAGAVIRRHMTHFGWQDAMQLDEWTLTAPSSSLTVARGTNVLNLTCSRVGAVSFPANVDKYQMKERIHPTGGDYVIEVKLNATLSITSGALGFGFFNAANSEYVCLEYDGTTFTMRGVGTTTFTANGTTSSASSKTWMRIEYTQSTNTFAWKHSTDGTTWTTITTEASRAFTLATPHMIPTLYWRSGDTNASAFTPVIAQFNLADEYMSVARFGNWVEIANATEKWTFAHFQSIPIALGTFVGIKQLIGYAGETGFDATSGRINTEHLHCEVAANNTYEYSRAQAVNPLRSTYLPRTNVSNNVSVARATGNDPDGVDSHKLTITITRADQDFDVNSVTLTANTTSRTINLDTRAGLNANVDIPKQSGVYIVPSSFNENSATLVWTVYFNKSVVGSTFTSYSVLDSDGATLASG